MDAQSEKTYLTQIARLFPRQGEWTEETFFMLPESNQIVELVNGEVIIMTPAPDDAHQSAVGELFFALKQYCKTHKTGIARIAPYDVRLKPGTIRQPDVLFIREENRKKIGDQYFDGGPDWVAEVISPGSRTADTVEKLKEYAQAGVPEYWLLDPRARTVMVYVLDGEAYRLVKTYEAGEAVESVMLEGFGVQVYDIFSGGA